LQRLQPARSRELPSRLKAFGRNYYTCSLLFAGWIVMS
jgi:hypothetical protein